MGTEQVFIQPRSVSACMMSDLRLKQQGWSLVLGVSWPIVLGISCLGASLMGWCWRDQDGTPEDWDQSEDAALEVQKESGGWENPSYRLSLVHYEVYLGNNFFKKTLYESATQGIVHLKVALKWNVGPQTRVFCFHRQKGTILVWGLSPRMVSW